MTNQESLVAALMDSLTQVGWVPGLPTVISALSVDLAQIAKDLAEAGAVMVPSLTDTQLGELCRRSEPAEIRAVLLELARGEE